MKKYSIYPIEDMGIFEQYRKARDVFWTPNSIDYSRDDYDSLDEPEKEMVKKILFFFANADTLVADNILDNFMKLDLPSEANLFLAYQIMNENIHAETYGDAIESYISSLELKEEAYHAIEGSDIVANKLKWMEKWVNSNDSVNSLLAFILVESIFFSSTFATIFWMKKLEYPLQGFFKGNKEILRDEVSHYEFSTYCWNKYYKNALDKNYIIEAVIEAVNIECNYIDYIVTSTVKSIDPLRLKKYVKHVANIVLSRMGYEHIFPNEETDHNLRFMDELGIQSTVNFFEITSDNYTKVSGNISFDNF